jgi:hypothetical protein
MRTAVVVATVVATAVPAFAQAPALPGAQPVDEVVTERTGPSDQSMAAEVGIAVGGRVTPGGLRVAGHWLYQLSSKDWFDGSASFTFGGGGRACYADGAQVPAVPGRAAPPTGGAAVDAQMTTTTTTCDHGLTGGQAVEIAATVRRMFAARGAFQPFARVGLGFSLVRFRRDDVDGFVVPLHAGAGVRTTLTPSVALVTQADLAVGLGGFDHGMGVEPQLGFAITAGAELDLR